MNVIFLKDAPGVAHAGETLSFNGDEPILWDNNISVKFLSDSDKTGEGFKASYKMDTVNLLDESKDICVIKLPNGVVRWGRLNTMKGTVDTIESSFKLEKFLNPNEELTEDAEMTFFFNFVHDICDERKFEESSGAIYSGRATPKHLGILNLDLQEDGVHVSGIPSFRIPRIQYNEVVGYEKIVDWIGSESIPF